MKVKVLSHTENPETTCAVSMRSTRTNESAYELLKGNEDWKKAGWISKCMDALNLFDSEYGRSDELDTGCSQHIKYHDCKYKNRNKCHWYDRCAERLLEKAKKMKHWGVFEHVTFTVSVSGISRSLTHQLVRHRIASYLQQSQRAVEINTEEKWYVTPPTILVGKKRDGYDFFMGECAKEYETLIKLGFPAEDARFVLPNATKTHIVITMNARSWLHFFKLRLDKHAQWEIRGMAQEILKEFMKISPLIFEGAGELDI